MPGSLGILTRKVARIPGSASKNPSCIIFYHGVSVLSIFSKPIMVFARFPKSTLIREICGRHSHPRPCTQLRPLSPRRYTILKNCPYQIKYCFPREAGLRFFSSSLDASLYLNLPAQDLPHRERRVQDGRAVVFEKGCFTCDLAVG